MVLRNAGPLGGPGFPEWGMLPIPKALIKQGHRDMLRISDARMSGTSYGACVLHVAPESYVGGPLALLRTGDIVRLDLPSAPLDMLVDDERTRQPRRAAWKAPSATLSSAATARCSRSMSRRPTRAAISISCNPTSAAPPASPTFSEGTHDRLASNPTRPAPSSWTSRPPRSAPRSSSAGCATSSSRACCPVAPKAETWSARPLRCATSRRARTAIRSRCSAIPTIRSALPSRPARPAHVLVMEAARMPAPQRPARFSSRGWRCAASPGVVSDGGFRDAEGIAATRHARLSRQSLCADQPDPARGARHQRADRLRRCRGLSRRRGGRRRRGRHRASPRTWPTRSPTRPSK